MDIRIFHRNRLVKNLLLFFVFLFNALVLASFAIRVDLIAVLVWGLINILLYNMAKEDAIFKTVDLRKCFFLLMGLLAVTKKTEEVYLISSVYFFAIFLLPFILHGIEIYFSFYPMLPVKFIEVERRTHSVLPWFFWDIFISLAITMIIVYGFGYIDFFMWQLHTGAFVDQHILSLKKEISVCTGILLVLWYLLRKKKIYPEKLGVMEINDVIFLSVFAPFLEYPILMIAFFVTILRLIICHVLEAWR